MRRVRSLDCLFRTFSTQIYRRCPESYASTLATTSVAFGRGRVEGESVYQPSEGDLAEAEAILVKRGEMPTMGKEPAQS